MEEFGIGTLPFPIIAMKNFIWVAIRASGVEILKFKELNGQPWEMFTGL